MMKKLMIINIRNCEDKQRSQAMKIIVGVPGVESVALRGENKNQIAVIGIGVDSVNLINLLRKKLKDVELISVIPVDEDGLYDAIPETHEYPNYRRRPRYQAVVPYDVHGNRSNYFDNYPGYRYYG